MSAFFFNDAATTEIYTLSLHNALPILDILGLMPKATIHYVTNRFGHCGFREDCELLCTMIHNRSEEHTSELQSRFDLVCRLLLEKKKLTHTTGETCARGHYSTALHRQ